MEVDYDPLPAVVDRGGRARRPARPLQFDELGSTSPRASAAPRRGRDPLAGADVVVRARMVNQRIAVMPMEGNAIAVLPGGHDGRDDELTI